MFFKIIDGCFGIGLVVAGFLVWVGVVQLPPLQMIGGIAFMASGGLFVHRSFEKHD